MAKVYDFEFTIKVVGKGRNEQEAWEDAKEEAGKIVYNDGYWIAENIGEDENRSDDEEDRKEDIPCNV